jgi:hypothetical protein
MMAKIEGNFFWIEYNDLTKECKKKLKKFCISIGISLEDELIDGEARIGGVGKAPEDVPDSARMVI